MEDRGFEPLTPALPAQCSPAELIPHDTSANCTSFAEDTATANDLDYTVYQSTLQVTLKQHGHQKYKVHEMADYGQNNIGYSFEGDESMKHWLVASSFLGLMALSIPQALAAPHSGMDYRHGMMHLHRSLYPVSASMQPVDESSGRRWEVQSSVQVPREALKEAYKASQQAYTEKLKKYAKYPLKDAQKAVAAEHPGMKIQEIQLRNIRTSLVYMAIAEDDDDKYLVVVDAGNGKILMDKPLPTHHTKVFAGD